ncbi:Protein kinase domain-containing protein [Aphelenchoides bicaudatus]|nr:Protein kinase domain-containing protein [Aphelenchoides bicaudatus]
MAFAATRLDNLRRSFRQQKRTSMMDMKVLSKPLTASNQPQTHDPPQKFLYPLDDAGCSYEYTNSLINIGNQCEYEYLDTVDHNIGHGAYGDVYKGKAFDVGRQSFRPVAIKRMIEANVKCDELEAMKRIQNPFLVSLIDICHDENRFFAYIIMELCDIDLDRYLLTHTKDGFLSPTEYMLVMQNLAFGYYGLFKQNIVHRDIKPQNVLLVLSPNNGNGIQIAKLTDFGVCRVLDDSDGTLCNIAGTLGFMAPEIGANVLKPNEYNYMVDIWSIGCVLFQIKTGHQPFDEKELCRLFLHVACNNSSAYDLELELPEDTSESDALLIRGLLQVDSNRRFTPNQLYSFALKSMHAKDYV